MSSFRHHSPAANDADERHTSTPGATLPASLLAALAPRLVSARHVRDTPLTRVYDASAPDGRRLAFHVIAPRISALAGDADTLAAALDGLPTLPGLTIPAIEWISELDGFVCYATTWHPGVQVAAIDQTRRPSATAVAAASRALCVELHALHGRGLTHGMIVPELLTFVADEQRFMLEGAGVMTALHLNGVTPAEVYAACGNVTAAAPELGGATRGIATDARTDIFGLGGTLYQLLTGCPAFGGRTTATVMAAVLLDPRTTESTSPAGAAITDVILRCLEKDPADRWPDLGAMADALAIAAGAGAVPAPLHAAAPRTTSRVARAVAFLSASLLGGPRDG